jgi:heme-degrading monooxygenase HmoA
MKVMTIVRGEVPAERSGMFEAAYLSIRAESLPPGLEISYLTRRKDSSGTYTIETVWSSRDALDAMRSSTKPRAVALFEEVGVSPIVEIHEIVSSVP